jgi:DNA-binding response OmpR family regulator
MTQEHRSRATVLIVDDETPLADLYAAWLEDDYEVRTAYGGEEALVRIDEKVDVVLLDRLMSGISGEAVLAEIRRQGWGCQVALMTAVDPDLEIIDLEFDDYVVKPFDKDDLTEVVETLRKRTTLGDRIVRFCALRTKQAILEREVSENRRESSDEYAELRAEVEGARKAACTSLQQILEAGELDGLFRETTPREYS